MKNIVFMGTPEFAVKPLEKLYENFNIKLVVTQEDKLRNRNKLLPTPVKIKALELGLKVITPSSVNTDDFFEIILKENPDFIVIVAFGQKIGKKLIEHMKGRILNIHSSLLPKLRGAAPINWAIVNGFCETGVSIMSIDEGLDTGDILSFDKTNISISENSEELYNRLSIMGANLIVKTILDFDSLYKKRLKQDDNFSYAPIIKKDFGRLSFNDSALNIHNKVRGFYNWPSTFCNYKDEIIKIHRTELVDYKSSEENGKIVKVENDGFIVTTADGCIKITEIQFPSKKRILVSEYLKGNSIEIGEILR